MSQAKRENKPLFPHVVRFIGLSQILVYLVSSCQHNEE